MYLVKNSSSAGTLFKEIVGKNKLLKGFQAQRFTGVYVMFKRLYELYESVEAFFGILGTYFPIQGKKQVDRSQAILDFS